LFLSGVAAQPLLKPDVANCYLVFTIFCDGGDTSKILPLLPLPLPTATINDPTHMNGNIMKGSNAISPKNPNPANTDIALENVLSSYFASPEAKL
jgi:hypothetical protein